MQALSDIQFEEIKGVEANLGVITLTRPQALNALNHAMCLALDSQLKVWDAAKNIKAVIVKAAEGRAFCAGGDIRSIYELKKNNEPSIQRYFYDEYQMNKRIHHFSKPYIALLNGITMGGGVGISWHASHRVATEKLVFAMPETGIGFFPDVGTTYFLSRLPRHLGFYIGLTGVRLNADESVKAGFAQQKISSDTVDDLIRQLLQKPLDDNQAVTEVIEAFAKPISSSELFSYQEEIDNCFSESTMNAIIKKLKQSSKSWCLETAFKLESKSPTSLKVTLAALQKARVLSFNECMEMEYKLACKFVEGHDFFEGIRAAVIDKDQAPKWHPSALTEVTQKDVAEYFSA